MRNALVAALLGFPGAGKQALASALRIRHPELGVVDFDTIRAAMQVPSSPVATSVYLAVSAGEPIPDELFGQFLGEIVAAQPGDVLLQGYPRNLRQFESLTSSTQGPVYVLHLKASKRVIDERRRARGETALEEEHPGSFERVEAWLQPILDKSNALGQLLSLDATMSVDDLANATDIWLGPLRGDS